MYYSSQPIVLYITHHRLFTCTYWLSASSICFTRTS